MCADIFPRREWTVAMSKLTEKTKGADLKEDQPCEFVFIVFN